MVSCSNTKHKTYNSSRELTKQEVLNMNAIIDNWNKSLKKDGIPSYYGGIYTSNGFVYILTILNSSEVKEDILDRCKTRNGVLIKYCHTSKEVLLEQAKELDSLLLLNEHPEIEYSGHYLDEVNNRIVINIGDVSEDNITNFKKYIMDSPNLVFEKSKELIFY